MPTNKPQTTNKTDQNNHNLKILLININSIQNKTAELNLLTKEQNLDILCIQETKLTSKNKTPHIDNMTASRKDRQGKSGGGLVTYIRNNIPFTDTKILSNLQIQLD